MNVVFYLKKFFSEQQGEAAIPGLGVFCLSNETGRHRTIIFKEKAPRSKVFANYLAYGENITEGEAIALLEEWVANILDDLKKNNLAYIQGLGSFSVMSDGKVVFTGVSIEIADNSEKEEQNVKDQNDDDYGLDTPKPQPDEIGSKHKPITQKEKKTKDQKHKKEHKKVSEKEQKNAGDDASTVSTTLLVILASVLLLVLMFFVAYKYMPGFKERVDLLHGNTTSVEHTESIENLDNSSAETAGTLAENDETTVSVQETNAEKEIKKAPAYNVIGGAFSVKENAVKFSNEMKNKGYANVKLIYNDQKGLYMVSLQQFNNINDAVNFKDEVRNASGISCWVYKK